MDASGVEGGESSVRAVLNELTLEDFPEPPKLVVGVYLTGRSPFGVESTSAKTLAIKAKCGFALSTLCLDSQMGR